MKKNDPEHACDQHIASTLRKQRRKLGISQDVLAQRLGISFQQVQKYESGKNRIAASRLFVISQILDIHISDLYPDPAKAIPAVLPVESELMNVLDTLSKMDNKAVKNSLLNLAKTLVKLEEKPSLMTTQSHAKHQPIC